MKCLKFKIALKFAYLHDFEICNHIKHPTPLKKNDEFHTNQNYRTQKKLIGGFNRIAANIANILYLDLQRVQIREHLSTTLS